MGKFLRLPLKLIPKTLKLKVLQGVNKDYRWVVGSGVHGYWLGVYELYKQRAISACCTQGMVAYDVGAHAGFYTMMLARLSGKEGRVYAFEPNALNLRYLKTHLEINNINNVTILPIALGQDTGYTFFNESGNSSTGHVTASRTTVMVLLDSIDSLIDKKLIEPPNIIKIDVEGAELDVLRGAGAAIRTYHPIIFVAIDNHDNKDYIYDFLKDMGYAIDCLDNNPYEIKAFKES
ncbi:MAG: FkbM family methyltransferase [Thermodesulfobacteriota bacterium]